VVQKVKGFDPHPGQSKQVVLLLLLSCQVGQIFFYFQITVMFCNDELCTLNVRSPQVMHRQARNEEQTGQKTSRQCPQIWFSHREHKPAVQHSASKSGTKQMESNVLNNLH
jgi:hypothetical protein